MVEAVAGTPVVEVGTQVVEAVLAAAVAACAEARPVSMEAATTTEAE
jgi:hypothetical protein